MLRIIPTLPKQFVRIEGVARNFSSTPILLDQHWREEHGLPTNPNSFGPLSNMPDYSYMDGRPTPLGTNQKKRMLHQQEIAKKMVQSLKELDYAKKRYAQIQADKVAEKKKILDNKLKPKGHLLLKKDK